MYGTTLSCLYTFILRSKRSGSAEANGIKHTKNNRTGLGMAVIQKHSLVPRLSPYSDEKRREPGNEATKSMDLYSLQNQGLAFVSELLLSKRFTHAQCFPACSKRTSC